MEWRVNPIGSVGGSPRPLMTNESANTHLHKHDVSSLFV